MTPKTTVRVVQRRYARRPPTFHVQTYDPLNDLWNNARAFRTQSEADAHARGLGKVRSAPTDFQRIS